MGGPREREPPCGAEDGTLSIASPDNIRTRRGDANGLTGSHHAVQMEGEGEWFARLDAVLVEELNDLTLQPE